MNRLGRLVIVILAATSAIALLCALVFGHALYEPPPSAFDARTFGPTGHGAVVKALGQLGVRVEPIRTDSLTDVTLPLLIIEPEYTRVMVPGAPRDADGDDRRADEKRAAGEPTKGSGEQTLRNVIAQRVAKNLKTVLVVPKWEQDGSGEFAPTYRAAKVLTMASGTADLSGTTNPSRERESLALSGPLGTYAASLTMPQRLVFNSDATIKVNIAGDSHGSFIAANKARTLYVVADPDLLHNFNFDQAEHLALVHAFVTKELGTQAVALDEMTHGYVQRRSLLHLMSQWPGVLVLAHLVFLVLVLAWQVHTREPGVSHDSARQSPRIAIEVAASVLTHARRPAQALLLSRHVDSLIRYLGARLALPQRGDVRETAAALDTRARAQGIETPGETFAQAALAASEGTATLTTSRHVTELAARLLGKHSHGA
jgi:hypothetical protein